MAASSATPSSPGAADVSEPFQLNAHFEIGDRDADVNVTEIDGPNVWP